LPLRCTNSEDSAVAITDDGPNFGQSDDPQMPCERSEAQL
jgi:hypothetical protein